jgi:hypothetical protein
LIESDIDGGQFHGLAALPTGEIVPNTHWAEGCVGTLILLKVQTTYSKKWWYPPPRLRVCGAVIGQTVYVKWCDDNE